jgi:microcin C transport system permease protein
MTDLAVSRPVSVKARLFGVRVRPLTLRRWAAFKANRRGFLSAIVFLVLFVTCLFAELIANDRPILVMYDGGIYFPVFKDYPETAFGGTFNRRQLQGRVRQAIDDKGWAVWPHDPLQLPDSGGRAAGPAPTAPDGVNWLGTDDNARDVWRG